MAGDDLSLLDIEQGLTAVLAAREEAETPEEQAAADAAILAYLPAEIAKADGIARNVRLWRAIAAADKEEAQRLRGRAKLLESRVASLLSHVKYVMESLGKRRIEGKLSTLLLRGDGGRQPVSIQGWDKEHERWIDGNPGSLPAELCWAEIRMPYHWWEALCDAARNNGFLLPGGPDMQVKSAPRLSAIAEALSQPCDACDGDPCDESGTVVCGACGGSGLAGVPGAILLPRGSHVECS